MPMNPKGQQIGGEWISDPESPGDRMKIESYEFKGFKEDPNTPDTVISEIEITFPPGIIVNVIADGPESNALSDHKKALRGFPEEADKVIKELLHAHKQDAEPCPECGWPLVDIEKCGRCGTMPIRCGTCKELTVDYICYWHENEPICHPCYGITRGFD